MGRWIVVVAVAAVAGCGSDLDCTEDTGGVWRMSFTEVNGTCGAIPDDTISLDSMGEEDDSCVTHSRTLSNNECDLETDFECPLEGGGSLRWVMSLSHTSQTRIVGSGTLSIQTETASCRSTYDMDMRRL